MKNYSVSIFILLFGQVCFGQEHFTVAWSGNGLDQMNIQVVTANIGGVQLDAHDEIAVFDGAICCGKVVLTQSVDFSNASTYATIVASRQDGAEPNGYTIGHPIIFKFWDSGAGVEYDEIAAEYYDTGSTLLPPQPYAIDGSVIVKVGAPAVFKTQINVFLEGPYNESSGTMNASLNLPLSQPFLGSPWNYSGTETVATIPSGVVDWALIELRQATSPTVATSATTFATRAAFLKSTGEIVEMDGSSLPDFGEHILADGNNLYLVVRHRNHLAVMSSIGANLSNGVFLYDFTSGIGQVYGSGAGFKEIASGVFGMVSGDADNDGTVSVLDFSLWATDFGQTNSYIPADFDLDREISVLDFTHWAINFGVDNISQLKRAKMNQEKGKFITQVPK
ncbi:MAG: hypothetical protein WC384_16380 [Prolixibacteraceae bacterium]|jgi:hypothetical protein